MRKPRNLVRPGVIGTAVYLAFIATYAFSEWHALLEMNPNELGDFLAGCFAPLAFLWLVLGFFQQGDELRNSVAALRLQGEELRNSVEQQRQLVEVTREQLGLEQTNQNLAEEAAVRQAQPIFHISGISKKRRPIRDGDSFLPDRFHSIFTVRNVGTECRSFKISDGAAYNTNSPSVRTEHNFSFTYEIVKDSELKPRTITISCADLLGNDLQFEMILEPHDGQYGPEYRVSRDDGLFTKVS